MTPSGANFEVCAGARVLVTGGTGFIGAHLCKRLGALGLEVHATSRQDRARRSGEPIWWRANLADIGDARRIIAAVKPACVYHLAGMTGASPDLNLVLPTYHSLATSTINVLVHATELGCRRIVLAGSLNEPTGGFGSPVPGSPYAAAKWTGSAYGRMFHALYGAPVVNLRPFMTYGPGQDRAKLVPSVILSLLAGSPPRLTSAGVRGDWVFIDDVVDAFVAAAGCPDIEGHTFDLGTGALTSSRAVIEMIARVMKSETPLLFGAIPDRPFEQEVAADTAAAAERLGWRATTSLESGLRTTVDWYKANR
jgi:nucleoside-diphosphate-sugar epimerase